MFPAETPPALPRAYIDSRIAARPGRRFSMSDSTATMPVPSAALVTAVLNSDADTTRSLLDLGAYIAGRPDGVTLGDARDAFVSAVVDHLLAWYATAYPDANARDGARFATAKAEDVTGSKGTLSKLAAVHTAYIASGILTRDAATEHNVFKLYNWRSDPRAATRSTFHTKPFSPPAATATEDAATATTATEDDPKVVATDAGVRITLTANTYAMLRTAAGGGTDTDDPEKWIVQILARLARSEKAATTAPKRHTPRRPRTPAATA